MTIRLPHKGQSKGAKMIRRQITSVAHGQIAKNIALALSVFVLAAWSWHSWKNVGALSHVAKAADEVEISLAKEAQAAFPGVVRHSK